VRLPRGRSVGAAQTTIRTDVNRKDYRAWYGLGQTYELLDMHFYALSYYQHATALRCAASAPLA
jgi:hypothetical protein